MNREMIIDADSHIMEPCDTWLRYTSTADRSEALTIATRLNNQNGVPARKWYLEFQGRPLLEVCGSTPVGLDQLKSVAAKVISDASERPRRDSFQIVRESLLSYEEQSPKAAWDPHERLKWMDDVGISASLITPTWGSMWERYLHDNPRAICTNMDAYNRWALDFCSVDPQRLIPVVQLSVCNVDWAEKTVSGLAKAGAKVCALRPVLTDGKPLGHDHFGRVWAALEHHNMAVFFHVSGTGRGENDFFESGWYHDEIKGQHNGVTWSVASHVPIMLTLTNIIRNGILERHPNLRIAVVEHGSTWMGPWVEQFDATMPLSRLRDPKLAARCPQPPSSYLRKNVWLTPLEAENIVEVVANLNDRRVMFSTDFPHPECEEKPVELFRQSIAPLTEETQRRLLGQNAYEFVNGRL